MNAGVSTVPWRVDIAPRRGPHAVLSDFSTKPKDAGANGAVADSVTSVNALDER
jgi:hypothetical protein